MEENIQNQRKMIREVLKESKTPLMAKRIAQLIYRKFDGYRMSRFIVRDILWKKMRGDFEYDRDNYTYKLKNNGTNSLDELQGRNFVQEKLVDCVPETQQTKNLKEFIKKLEDKDGHETVSEFKNFIKSSYLGVDTGNKKFDELIRLVVKDNIITPSEELFLIEKSEELGLSYDLVEKVKKHIHSNNPYLDNIIHLIFEDGIISEKELIFLKEKEKENNFSKSFVNHRFWQIGISFYIKELIKYEDFIQLVELWEVGRITGFELVNTENWMIINLDIHSSLDIKEVMKRGKLKLQSKLEEYLSSEYNFDSSVLPALLKELDLEFKYNEEEEENIGTGLSMEKLSKILKEERRRIGDPAADLLVENILFRLEN